MQTQVQRTVKKVRAAEIQRFQLKSRITSSLPWTQLILISCLKAQKKVHMCC